MCKNTKLTPVTVKLRSLQVGVTSETLQHNEYGPLRF